MPAPYTTGFLGMRGTGDWSSDERPKNWREMVLRLYPNGAAPLTAIMSKLKSEKTDDPQFNWFQKDLASQRATITGVYTDVLSTAYTTGGVAGDVVYVKMAEADANHFKSGHQVIFRDADRSDVDVTGLVKSVVKQGASSYCAVMLLEDDDNSVDSATYNLSTCDVLLIGGTGYAEGSNMPDSIAYDPTSYYNYTQIFMTALSITRTARKTRLRTEDQYQAAKMEALQYHSIEMERAFLFGERYSGTGDNGKPIRFTRGIVNWIKSDSDAVNSDFSLDSGYSGKTWLQGGEDWLEDKLEVVRRWNDSKDLLGLCGSGVTKALTRLAKANGYIQLQPTTEAYGLSVVKWIASGITINLVEAPLFNSEETDRDRLIVGDPRRLVYRYIDDTTFLEDPSDKIAGYTRRDASDELYLTEAGLELHHAKGWANLKGFAKNNVV